MSFLAGKRWDRKTKIVVFGREGVNGTSIPQDHHDHLSNIFQAMTMPKTRTEYESMRSGCGVYRNSAVNTERAENQIAPAQHLILTPRTNPAAVDAVGATAVVAIREQKAYNEFGHRHLLGSKPFTFRARLHHPLFHTAKFLPPATTYNVRLTLNPVANLFSCPAADVPKMRILEAAFEDHVIHIKKEYVTDVVHKVFGGGGEMVFPITRHLVTERNIPRNTNRINMDHAITGTLPTRVIISFVAVNAWQLGRSTQNQYLYDFPGLTGVEVTYGTKKWPIEGGLKFKRIPAHGPPYSDAEVKEMVWYNTKPYDMIRSVFVAKEKIHEMECNAHDFFRYNGHVAIDLTALRCASETTQIREAKYEGNLTFTLTFSHNYDQDSMMIMTTEHANQITWQVPRNEIQTDY